MKHDERFFKMFIQVITLQCHFMDAESERLSQVIWSESLKATALLEEAQFRNMAWGKREASYEKLIWF